MVNILRRWISYGTSGKPTSHFDWDVLEHTFEQLPENGIIPVYSAATDPTEVHAKALSEATTHESLRTAWDGYVYYLSGDIDQLADTGTFQLG